jgi:hypothetical protein
VYVAFNWLDFVTNAGNVSFCNTDIFFGLDQPANPRLAPGILTTDQRFVRIIVFRSAMSPKFCGEV